MSARRRVFVLLALLLLAELTALPQSSRRRIGPKPPAPPNVFDQLEKQREEQPQDRRAQEAAARERRRAGLEELSRELPRLIGLAQNLQEQLNSTDLDATSPVTLRQRSQELERLARQIHKRVRSL